MSDMIKDLIAAQKAMEPTRKTAENPHFKSMYADLSAVTDAVLPALNAHNFALMFFNQHDETGDYVSTVFAHVSGERVETRVRLIVAKNDMQGYGSAQTYARRYGLMALAGIAPEDDDGNAAAMAPAPPPKADRAQDLSGEAQHETNVGLLVEEIKRAKTLDELKIIWTDAAGTKAVKDKRAGDAKDKRKAELDAKPPTRATISMVDDEIPY